MKGELTHEKLTRLRRPLRSERAALANLQQEAQQIGELNDVLRREHAVDVDLRMVDAQQLASDLHVVDPGQHIVHPARAAQ